MRNLLLLLFLSCAISLQAQNFWSAANESAFAASRNLERRLDPANYTTLQLDLTGLKTYLREAPMERTSAAVSSPLAVQFPTPEGGLETFYIYESPLMPDELGSRYPMIRSFAGRSAGEGQSAVRFVYSEKGFHAIFNTPSGLRLIAPYAEGDTEYYINYFHRDIDGEERNFVCGLDHDHDHDHGESHEQSPLEGLEFNEEIQSHQSANARNEQVELLEYEMAMACTAEWAALHGGTMSGAMSAMNVALNLLNGVYEPEIAIRFVFIPNNDELVFTDPNTDPYTDVDIGGGLLNQNQNALNNIIGLNNFDIGHVMTIACQDVGGIAGGTVCSNGKARGVTCQYSNLETVVLNVATHEVGHQFTASHTWDNCPGILEQRSGTTAFEPGSGSTLLSYAGSCGAQNVMFGGDIYFHVGSLQQMYDYSQFALGAECPDIIPTDNNKPELEIPLENGFYIPISTPFELTATATDPDGDDLTYCWEQYNTGPLSELGNPLGTAPSFRSYPPTTSPTRVFPRIQSILTNSSQVVEVLPTYTRNLKFRCTARDNDPMAGGTVWEEVSFEATESAGPFFVTNPNTFIDWEVGSYEEVTWDVANTNLSPVNCQEVDIYLSIDGGFTYPYTLAENVPNDGSHFVTVPNAITGGARVKVKASNSIFFDISNFNFEIIAPSEPGFALDVSPYNQLVCSPDPLVIDLNTLSLLDYDSLVTFSIEGLPSGAVPQFSANPVLPSDGATLTVETDALTENGTFDLLVTAIAQGGDTLVREASFNLVINDFSAFSPSSPANGVSGISELPTFTWETSPYAESYDIEIATSPEFGNTIVESNTGIVGNSYDPDLLLEKNTLYFWRIRPSNACGKGEFSPVIAFHTETFACSYTPKAGDPTAISADGLDVVEDPIIITNSGQVNDLNVYVNGTHDLVSHLDVSLISPAGTEVLLFANECPTTTVFNLSLDDEAPGEINCPTLGLSYQPEGSLSDFDGEEALGTWILKVEVNNTAGSGGFLVDWGIEICTNVTANPPFLVTNDTLPLPSGIARKITNDFLLSEDENNGPEDLTYTLVTAPQYGTVYFQNEPLGVGGQFRQSSINAGNVKYLHDGGSEIFDQFNFAVEDGEGGWFGTPAFNIKIDESVMVGVEDLDNDNDIFLFPNPTRTQFNIQFIRPISGDLDIRLVNVQGQDMGYISREGNNTNIYPIDVQHLAAGIYFVQVSTSEGVFTKRLVIQ